MSPRESLSPSPSSHLLIASVSSLLPYQWLVNTFLAHSMVLTHVQPKSSLFLYPTSFSKILLLNRRIVSRRAMHASFKFIAMLVLVTSTFTPAYSTPIECVLILFTIEIRLIHCSIRGYCPNFDCDNGFKWVSLPVDPGRSSK